jgi:hypothetical protein
VSTGDRVNDQASTTLIFQVVTPHGRFAALDRRDDIIEHLRKIGMRLSMLVDGTDIIMADAGAPTVGEALIYDAMGIAAEMAGEDQ